jgi:hypothetical protein
MIKKLVWLLANNEAEDKPRNRVGENITHVTLNKHNDVVTKDGERKMI